MRGFTLVEVLVALMVVAMGLAALMVAVSGAARTSGYLRDKTLAQWIALNRLSEVRLSANKSAQTADTGEVQFANRTWHYDTRYFPTSIATMKRVVVRVYAGETKVKGNPVVEATSFLGEALGAPGNSNSSVWTSGNSTPATPAPGGSVIQNANPTQIANPVGTTNPGVTPTPTATPPTTSQ